MSIVLQYPPQDPSEQKVESMTMTNLGGRPKGGTGNGKSAKERIARAKREFEVEQHKADLDTKRVEAALAQAASERKAEQAKRVHDLYVVQEEKRAPQFQIDQRGTLILLASLAAIMFVTTAVLTADGTIGSAVAARYAFPWFGFLLFGAIEVAILVFLLVYYVRGSRIDHDGTPVKAAQWFVAMIAASIVAVAASVYHVVDLYSFDWTSVDMWVGVGIRLTTTVFFVLVAKAVATVLFAKAVRL